MPFLPLCFTWYTAMSALSISSRLVDASKGAALMPMLKVSTFSL